MKLRRCIWILCVLFLASRCPGSAQDYLFATGSPVYSSTLPIDQGTISVNNGEIHLELPIAVKKQRGQLALNERLIYDSRIWKIVQNGSAYSWQPTNVPSSSGGWRFQNGLSNLSTTYQSNYATQTCGSPPPNTNATYTQFFTYNWATTDADGTVHHTPAAATEQALNVPSPCPAAQTQPNASSNAIDNSGIGIHVANYTSASFTDNQNISYLPGSGTSNAGARVTDASGNYWSTDSNGNLIDTSGRTPVTSSTNGNKTVYTVLVAGGGTQQYIVTMTTVAFNTSFGETAVTESSGSFSAIQSITLPDGSSYQFSYDSGTTAGHYGELTSMTLPTGGVITYNYSDFYDSFQNHNRWITSMVKGGGTTTFSPSVVSKCSSSAGCQESVNVTSPAGNDTTYTFYLDKTGMIGGASWHQAITSYQGSGSSRVALRATATAFNYQTAQYYEPYVNIPDGTYEVALGETDQVTLLDAAITSQVITTFASGVSLPSEIKAWDFYPSSGAAPSQPTTDTTFQYYGGNLLSSQVVKDGAGNQIASTTFGYDETTPITTSGLPQHTATANGKNGYKTSEHDWVNASGSTIDQTMIYDDAGNLLSSTTPNGKTSYSHDSTDTFVTTTTLPTPSSGVSITSSAAYDPFTGAVTSTTDNNNQVTTYKGFDSLNRPTEVDYPDGGRTNLTYPSPLLESIAQAIDSRANNINTYSDGYGRISQKYVANGQATNPWFESDTCYDTSGRISFTTYPYASAGGGNLPECANGSSIGGDAYSYDGLDRVKQINHADGTSRSFSYKGRATETVDESGVAKITQVDAFGRTMAVCEVSSNGSMPGSGSPSACGTDIAGNGFVTTYAYDNVNHKITVLQGAQTRLFQTDAIGRSILTQEPERGATTYAYTYNTVGLVVAKQRPAANQSNPNTLTTTTTQYDSLGRTASIGYSDGTGSKHFYYDAPAGSPIEQGQTNLRGRLSQATAAVSGGAEDSTFSYDALGRVLFTGQCFPNDCAAGYKRIAETYDHVGNLTSQSDPTAGNISYTYNIASQLQSATNNTYAPNANTSSLISSVVNGPNGPISYVLGNGLGAYRSYDSMGRLVGNFVCQGAPAEYCNGDQASLYGTTRQIIGSHIIQNCDNVLNACLNYGYDDMGRVAAMTVLGNSQPSYTYVYDRYGNRWQQNGQQSSQLQFNTSNNIIQLAGFTNDAAGNMTRDPNHTYTYDAEGNLTAVDGGATATYLYDALNRRVNVTKPSSALNYTYDYLNRRVTAWAVSNDFGTQGSEYWGATNTRIAFRNGPTFFDHLDGLGTERMQTDANGAEYGAFLSQVYGDGYTVYGQDPSDLHYAGMTRDQETDTQHADSRQYSTATGRWMSPDPYDGSYDLSDPQTFNRFSYVVNNPLFLSDPSGRDPFTIYITVTEVASSGCGPVCGTLIGAGASVGALLADLLFGGWFAPHFEGSLHPRPNTPSNQQRLHCSGKAYVMAGNPVNVGQEGFPNVNVTNGSAAVIPRQFTGQLTGGPLMREIGQSASGTVTAANGATESFSSITQAVGNAKLGTALQAQNIIMARAPGQLVLEIVGGKDLGAGANATLDLPNVGEGCPAGTSPVAP